MPPAPPTPPASPRAPFFGSFFFYIVWFGVCLAGLGYGLIVLHARAEAHLEKLRSRGGVSYLPSAPQEQSPMLDTGGASGAPRATMGGDGLGVQTAPGASSSSTSHATCLQGEDGWFGSTS